MHSHDADCRDPLMPSRWFALLMGGVLALGAVQAAALPVNGDAAWYLYMAGRILDGDRAYEDIVDTNPPLIVWLNEAIVASARAVGVSPLTAFPIVVFALIGLALALSWRLGRGLPPAVRQVGLVTWAYLLLIYVGGMSGQREHLLLMLILPYAYGAIAEARGVRTPAGLAVLTGLMAGLGFAMKPFFVLAVVMVELYLAIHRGRRSLVRPQALAIGAVFLAYAAALMLRAPEYFAVARRFAPLYPHHMPGGPALLASSWRLAIVAVAAGLSYVVARRRAPGWAEVFGLLAASLTAAVYLTGKGWRYHWFPAVAIAATLLGGCAALVVTRHLRGRPTIWPAAGLTALVMMLSSLSLLDLLFERRRDMDTINLVRSHAGDGGAVLILSCWVHTSFPMINEAGATWGMRHPMLWQIAAFYAGDPWDRGRYHRSDAMTAPERRFVAEVAEDFVRTRPALLLIDDDPPTPALPGFDYLEYFRREPRFARALGNYAYLTRTGPFRVYRRLTHAPTTGFKSVATIGRSSERSAQAFDPVQSDRPSPVSSRGHSHSSSSPTAPEPGRTSVADARPRPHLPVPPRGVPAPGRDDRRESGGDGPRLHDGERHSAVHRAARTAPAGDDRSHDRHEYHVRG